jgi:integrase
LRYATQGAKLDGEGGWRDVRIDRLDPQAIGVWRRRLPERSAWGIHKALRQALNYAVRVSLIDVNVATLVANPEPKRTEVPMFASVAELEITGAEMSAAYQAVPVFVGLTGLRVEEWLGLERRDVDRAGRVVHVRRVYVDGQLRPYGKQSGSLRAVPLVDDAIAALATLPARIDTPILFPAVGGGRLNLHNWRRDEWAPALKAAGLPYRRPNSLRHTYASFQIAARVHTHELARLMGTSEAQIDATFGHLLPDSIDRSRAALEAFITRSRETDAASEEGPW